jgi:hypothetical protein
MMTLSLNYESNVSRFTTIKILKFRWAEAIDADFDIVISTCITAFISMLQIYSNILKPCVTNVYFEQR